MTTKRYWKQLLVTSENNCLKQLFFILLFLWNKMAHTCWVHKTTQSLPLCATRISSCKCNTHNPGLAEVIGRFFPLLFILLTNLPHQSERSQVVIWICCLCFVTLSITVEIHFTLQNLTQKLHCLLCFYKWDNPLFLDFLWFFMPFCYVDMNRYQNNMFKVFYSHKGWLGWEI